MAELPNTQRVRIEVCRIKAAECRDLAKKALKPSTRIMMEHMAETWDRIAADIQDWLIKKQ